MKQEQKNIISKRAKSLAPRLENDEFRSSFLISYTKMFISNQLRALRADKSQSEFSELLQKPQSVISRIENPDASKSLNTLFEIANTLKLALIIRFVDYPTFIKVTSDFSEETLAPKPYQRSEIEALIQPTRDAYIALQRNPAPIGHNSSPFQQNNPSMWGNSIQGN